MLNEINIIEGANMKLSQRIREVREERGLTVEQLGELVGKTGPMIHKY